MKKKYLFIVNGEKHFVCARSYDQAYNKILKRVIAIFGKANITDGRCIGKMSMNHKKQRA